MQTHTLANTARLQVIGVINDSADLADRSALTRPAGIYPPHGPTQLAGRAEVDRWAPSGRAAARRSRAESKAVQPDRSQLHAR